MSLTDIMRASVKYCGPDKELLSEKTFGFCLHKPTIEWYMAEGLLLGIRDDE